MAEENATHDTIAVNQELILTALGTSNISLGSDGLSGSTGEVLNQRLLGTVGLINNVKDVEPSFQC